MVVINVYQFQEQYIFLHNAVVEGFTNDICQQSCLSVLYEMINKQDCAKNSVQCSYLSDLSGLGHFKILP